MTIRLNAMTARTIHLKDSVTLSQISLECQHVFDVGIGGTKLVDSERNPKQHDRDCQNGKDNLLRRGFFGDKLIIQAI